MVDNQFPETRGAGEFLRLLHPDDVVPHRLLVWTMTGESKTSHWFPSIDAAANFVGASNADAIFFGIGLAPRDLGPHARCKTDEVIALPGLVCDIDISSPVHQKLGLPPTIEEALRILPSQVPPTVVWETGHGLQGAWLFRETWVFDSPQERDRAAALSQRWHRYLAGDAKRLGYAIDPVHDLARVLRIPGSVNKKVPSDPRPVRVIRNNNCRYDPSDLENILDTLGVPEHEVRTVDDSGRTEYGDLHVDPRVQLAPDVQAKLDALLVNDSDFARIWKREKRMRTDNSWSAFALSIGNKLATVPEFSDQSIIDILTIHRREHGDAGKRGPKIVAWFTKYTIPKARAFAAQQRAKEAERAARREKREATAHAVEKEKIAIATAADMTEEECRSKILDYYGLPVSRLVQVGDNVDPAFRVELSDGRRIGFPSLLSITSFQTFRRYVWLAIGRMLPASADKKWPEVATLLGRLKVIEDVGGGSGEMLTSYLREWLFQSRHGGSEFFEQADNQDFIVFPPGPLSDDQKFPSRVYCTAITWPRTSDHLIVALKLISLPVDHRYASCGTCFQNEDRVFAVFKLPPFVRFLRDQKWTKDVEVIEKLLESVGLKHRDTILLSTVVKEAAIDAHIDPLDKSVRLRRLWTGWFDAALQRPADDPGRVDRTVEDQRRRAAGDYEGVIQ